MIQLEIQHPKILSIEIHQPKMGPKILSIEIHQPKIHLKLGPDMKHIHLQQSANYRFLGWRVDILAPNLKFQLKLFQNEAKSSAEWAGD